MTTVAETFAQAWSLHQTGSHAQAEQLYRQIIQQEPGHADAWCLLAAVCQAQNKVQEAESSYRHVVQLWPNHPIANNGLGILLAQQGQLDEAANSFERLLQVEPGNSDAHNNLGLVRVYQRRFDDAIASYQQALRLKPDFLAARDNLCQAMQQKAQADPRSPAPQSSADAAATASRAFQEGIAFFEQGNFGDAMLRLRQSLRLQPNNAEAHGLLGNLHYQQRQTSQAMDHYRRALRIKPNYIAAQYNLGVALQDQGKMAEAEAQYRNTLRLDPTHSTANNNLGLVLMEQGKLAEAIRCFQQALKLNPRFVEACVNLGNAIQKRGDIEEAIRWNEEALRLDPKCAAAWNNLGMAYKKLGRFDDALAKVEHALQLDANDLLAHWNRSVIWLLRGEFEKGWPEHEWRWVQPGFGKRTFTQPLWDGSALDGKTLLLYAEQGLGDTLQFIRYVPMVKERGGKVIVQCHQPLLKLLQCVPGIDRFEVLGAPLSAFDVHAALLSLPGIFHTTLETVPATVPYLDADPELVEKWRVQLETHRSFKIGISWQGNPGYREDKERSFPLRCFAPLTQVEGINLLSLQKGHGSEQLQSAPVEWRILDLARELDETTGAFMDTAAVMKNLDLVITSDTAIAHLAGALGVPVWVVLARIPDWRWLLDREDCPWYPTMRLFRQRKNGDWAEVFDRVALALKTFKDRSP